MPQILQMTPPLLAHNPVRVPAPHQALRLEPLADNLIDLIWLLYQRPVRSHNLFPR